MGRGERLRFDGWIAGLGTASGTRVVAGCWPRSPFGAVADVMVERPGGHRVLLAATTELARFVSGTYAFDEVVVVPVAVGRDRGVWTVQAGPLRLRFVTGGRPPLGRLLRAVPAPVGRRLAWTRAIDVVARVALPGVRTYGSAGSGRREWYSARDLHRIAGARGSYEGADLGGLAAVDPPVRFGFTSVPRDPALVRVTTTVQLPG